MMDPEDSLAVRIDRVRTLTRRLSRARDTAVEAELIAQLTLETEKIQQARSERAASAPGLRAGEQPADLP